MTKSGLRGVLNYCFPVGRISGVAVGIHWTFPVFALLYSLQATQDIGGEWGAVMIVAFFLLFGTVLAHEFGHVFAARREGIGTDRVMLWPLGGLAFLGEEATGPAEVRIAAAGPAVNLGFAIALLPVLLVLGVSIGFRLFDPFDWSSPALTGFPQKLGFTLYKLNLIAFLFNLIPAFPMDGGRVLRGFLEPRHGQLKATLVATTIGMVLAGGFFVWGLLTGQLILALIGVFVGLTAYQTRRQVKYIAAEMQLDKSVFGYDFSMGHTSLARTAERENRKEKRREEKERERQRKAEEEERRIEEEVDQLLDKISRDGIDSLTRKERAFLERASRRQR